MWLMYVRFILLAPHMECLGRWNVFSTNTLLQWVNNSFGHDSNHIDNNVNFGISTTNCKAIHLSMLVKNGAHYPMAHKLHQIKALHEKIVKLKDSEKFKNLDDWKLLYDKNVAGTLSSKGIEEIAELGNRFGNIFKSFLKVDANKVKLVSSYDQKAVDTSKYFEQGLRNQLTTMSSLDRKFKANLEIAKHCRNFETLQQNDSDTFKQFHLFSKTPQFKEILRTLKRKLGMNIELTAADVYLINEWCAYGTYISNDMTWCHLLSDDDRDVLEYGLDILNYYKYSYGQAINSRMMCPLVKDIFDTMDSTINNSVNYFKETDGSQPSYTKAQFQFVGDDTLIPLMTALGMFKDSETLLATNTNKMVNRKFRTSQISSFGSSVAFILYACDNTRRLALDEFNPGQQEFRIQAFVNEKGVPFCAHSFYCLYRTTKQRYIELFKNCNLTEICGANPTDERSNQDNITQTKNGDAIISDSKARSKGDTKEFDKFPKIVKGDNKNDDKQNNKCAGLNMHFLFIFNVFFYFQTLIFKH